VIDQDFRTKLLALLAADFEDVPVEKGKVSEDKAQPWVYYQRGGGDQDTDLDGTKSSIRETWFDIEVAGLDDDAVQPVADALKDGLNGFRGSMGSSTVLGAFWESHSDDYAPKHLDADEGFYLATFRAQVIHK
jgi:hypothetical protein